MDQNLIWVERLNRMRKFAAIILIMAMLFTLTGCKAFSYWDGMTKNQAKRYICKELEEKYSEKFTVIETYRTGTGYLWANCAPKSDESLVFQARVDSYGKKYVSLMICISSQS